ncbi:hypothetical protein [Actinomadura rubrisoli]|uniref:hypothetical protein n=1 Tax=Actinomadura rubrisoli TaxID=2530368 RepID=UPI00140513BA|nr:hypothetical protein [Actinomadura rubrisoli]
MRFLAAELGPTEIVAAARNLGAGAADAIEALLTADPLERLPARIPDVPEWAAPGMLPQILLRGRERALPDTATAQVVMLLAMSKLGEVYAGIEMVRDVCDAHSLAGFAWALFERSERYGASAGDGWALDQLGRFGDDATALRLAPLHRGLRRGARPVRHRRGRAAPQDPPPPVLR